MPTNTFRRAAAAENTGEVLVTLLTIEAAGLSEPLRFAGDGATAVGQHTDSRGERYVWTWFTVELPEQVDGRARPARIVIPNLSAEVIEAIRSTVAPPIVTVEMVLASDPDTVEAGPWYFELRTSETGAGLIEGGLAVEPVDDGYCPMVRFTPATCPGIFQ